MKKKIVVGLALILSLGLLVSAEKKDQGKKAEEAPAPEVLPICGFSRIAVTPASVDDPEIYVGAGKEIQFTAQAYDQAGKEVPANLVWYFRGLPQGEKLAASDGHKLTASGASAALSVSGRASGTFRIAAEGSDCLDPNGRPLRGTAQVEIYPAPGEPARCGPVLVMYGEREITNEKLLGYINFIFRAEIYGPRKLKGYKIQFYLDDKKVTPKRGLTYDKKLKPGMEQEAGYWAYVPVWLKAGDYSVGYELLKDNKPVCSSTNTYFTAR